MRVFNESGGTPLATFDAYEPGFQGGVRVAVGDVNGDGTDDIITAPGPGRAPTIKVFSAAGALLGSFDAFASSFLGGAFVAAANMDDDAAAEVVVGAGAGGGPHVKVLNGLTGASTFGGFFAFETSASEGVRVAAGVLNGVKAIAVTTRTTGAVVRAFDPTGGALSGATSVAGGDGDLSVAISGGVIHMLDAAPRLSSVSPTSVRDHTRPKVELTGASLGELADDVEIGNVDSQISVLSIDGSSNRAAADLLVPEGTPAGAVPITVTVRSPGGTVTHALTTNALSVQPRANALREFVTTGVGSGGGPHVRTFTQDGPVGDGFLAHGGADSSGVRVARGDLDGDGVDEIVTAPGPGQPPIVRVFDQQGHQQSQINAYDPSFTGGVFVAVGAVVAGDNRNFIVTGADAGGGPHVKVLDSSGGLSFQFMAYDPNFRGGVRVATADVDGDGVAEIVTAPGAGGGPHVKAVTETGEVVDQFMAYSPQFAGGVFVAGADVDGDGIDEIVTGPGAGGGPHVRLFGADGPLGDGFMAYAPAFTGGVSVGRVGDELGGPNLIAVGAGPGGGPHVQIVDPDGTAVDSFFAYDRNFTGGVFVAGGVA